MTCTIAQSLQLLFTVLNLAILGRVLYSWVDPTPYPNNQLKRVLWLLTEPLLEPIRRFMPPTGMFDLSPIVALFVLVGVGRALPIVFPYC